MVSRGQSQDQDRRVGRVHFFVSRVARQIGWQLAARRIDGGLHVSCGRVDVAVQIELQNDAGCSKRAGRRHFGQRRRCARTGAPAESPRKTPSSPGWRPADVALTWMVGKSTSGNGATGSNRNATAPASAIATVKSVVATGRRMKVSEKLMRRATGHRLLVCAVIRRLGRSAPRDAQRPEKLPASCTASAAG